MEAEIKNGGFKLHNLFSFDQSLTLGWHKRYLRSNSKWRIFVDMENFKDIFTFGIDNAEGMSDVLQIPLWLNLLKRLKVLWGCPTVTDVASS